MANGMMNTLLAKAYATSAAASVQISAMTLVVGGSTTGAANVWVHAIGGSLYLNEGVDASATNCTGVIAEGAPQLIPVSSDPRVIAKDSGAKVGSTWWK